ncbi:hypothetical protein OG730_14380 [Streptomyces sp. NBC_01298]|uniref:hypothetical protein n=1 Tax=Streptomyces sp. NBC_01298 TaxID=2903817 RepID=UPI002E0E49A3|nr:hypothetical protein OG730_14380 [Streptomyces sp. NBC_01298]
MTKPSATVSAVPVPLPRRLTAAAALTALEGLALAGPGVADLYTAFFGGGDFRQAATGGVTLLVLAALPLVAALGLLLRRRWSRGPALVTQLMSLPVAWMLWTAGGSMRIAAAALALAAVAVAALVVNHKATEALGIGPAEQAR